jgi:hypothetical protein
VKYILRQAGLTTLSFAVLYGFVLGLTFIFVPDPPEDGSLDTWTAGDTLYLSSPKYAMLQRHVLATPERKVLLVGASNVGVGFGQAQVQAHVPCAKVSSLALGSENISELRQMVDLVHEVQDSAAQRSDTWVFGVWYGMFADTALRWPDPNRHPGDTDLDIERYRYGFYRRTAAGPVPVLPIQWLPTAVVLIRPYLLLDKTARDLVHGLEQELHLERRNLTGAEREKVVMSDKDKQEALAYWHEQMGGKNQISADQVALLRKTIEELLNSREKVVLADLPIPSWHRNASPYEPGYERLLNGVFAHFDGRPGFAALRMDDLSAEQDFSDEVHPRPHMAPIWAARLGAVLDPLVCGEEDTAAVAAAGAPRATSQAAVNSR